MNSLALSFHDVKLNPVMYSGDQIWLRSSEIAEALGYKQSDAVTKLFNRNADEFTDNMTQVIDNPQTPNLGVRIFTLRGCHLIAMFARTAVAKEFRKWVLDLLDREVTNQLHATTVLEREQLNQAIVTLVAKNGRLNYSDAYKLVHQRFNVEHTHELNRQQLADAVTYVHWLTVSSAADNKPTLPENIKEDIRNLCIHARYLRAWWAQCGEAGIRALNRDMAGGLHDHFVDANMSVTCVVKAMGFTDVPELKTLEHYPFEGKGWERQQFHRALVKH